MCLEARSPNAQAHWPTSLRQQLRTRPAAAVSLARLEQRRNRLVDPHVRARLRIEVALTLVPTVVVLNLGAVLLGTRLNEHGR